MWDHVGDHGHGAMSSLHHNIGLCYSDVVDYCSDDDINHPTDDVTTVTTATATTNQKAHNRSKKKKQSKSQHSLDRLRQRVSYLMTIFEGQGWFIPMPDSININNSTSTDQHHQQNKKNGGKVWSNRNYGADKKRQRKQSERVMLESRILQLEAVLKDEHGVVLNTRMWMWYNFIDTCLVTCNRNYKLRILNCIINLRLECSSGEKRARVKVEKRSAGLGGDFFVRGN